MTNYNLLKRYYEFRGLDTRSSELNRPEVFSPSNINTDYNRTGGIKKREGIKIAGKNYGIYGAHRFQSISYFGEEIDELILFGSVNGSGVESKVLYRLVKKKMTVTNSLSSTNDCDMKFYYDNTTGYMIFSIIESDGTVLLNKNTISPSAATYTVTSLETDIDAVSGLSCSTPDTTAISTYVYMMDFIDVTIPNGLSKDLTFYTIEEIDDFNGGGASPSVPVQGFGGNTHLVSATVLNNVLYFGSSESNSTLMKYDGSSAFQAGSRFFPNFAVANSVAQSSPINTFRGDETFSNGRVTNNTSAEYWIQLQTIDHTGNVTVSPLLQATATLASNTNARYVTSGPRMNAGKYGYAVSDVSAQNSVLTINLASNSGLKVGDMACFWDDNQKMIVYREVTAASASAITISSSATPFGIAKNDRHSNLGDVDQGGAVDILADAYITAGVSFLVYRTKASDSTLYFLMDYPAGIFGTSASSSFIDDLTDAELGAAYLNPQQTLAYPEKFDILSSYNNSLILGGMQTQKESITYSNVTQVESFSPTNSIAFESTPTMIGQSGEILMVGTGSSIYTVSGDLNTFAFRVDKIADNIGGVSHSSLQKVDEGTLFFLSEKGPYMFSSGRGLRPIGPSEKENVPRITPFFTSFYENDAYIPLFSKASSGVWKAEKKYYLYIPYALNDGNDLRDPKSTSSQIGVLFVYDYGRDSWLQWDGIRATGGVYEYKDSVFMLGIYTDSNDYVVSDIQRQQRINSIYAYCDHDQPISWNYDFQWETMGEPSIFKKFLRLNVFGTPTQINSAQILGIETYRDYDITSQSTDTSITWSGEQNRKIKLKSDKMKAMKLRFYDDSTLAGYNNPVEISGYEIEAVAPYKLRIKQ